MATKEDLVKTIKEWIEHDNAIKSYQKKMKEHKTEKKTLTDTLVNIMKNNEIDCFDINDGKIIFCKNKVKMPLNKKTLLTNLEKYFKNNPNIDVADVSEFVLDNRMVQIKENIRRK
jgi:hypothetical protein